MPARVMRGEVNSSESLSMVSLEADLTFRALVVSVDDYGRIDARLPVLKGLLFPLRDSVTIKKIDKWISELESIEDPPVLRYVVDGRPYLLLTGWETHRGKSRRGSKSRHPDPVLSNTGLPRRSDDFPGDPPGSRRWKREVEAGVGGGSDGDASHPKSSRNEELVIWSDVNTALKSYMPRSSGLTLTDSRRRSLGKLVSDHGADAPIAAIHGYAALHLTSEPSSGFDPLKNFTPETCWSGKAGKYIDADRAARDSGQSRPFKVYSTASSFEANVIEMAQNIRRRQNEQQ